ncbi:MAG TPA: efflux RND transporter periplasmic adaptor subunit [Geminicoccus sp.]|uniref:efflux RND transporter periplasmic adaptor subunit n=1 Tax=Geminicoccus sp. TaxID=2024832 RepID=UPI002CEEB9CB|nr:efflux RND transporter periplasmic adaptor subunit [Geminicoccus sp.]HWL68406.1 efflux RND transporter periplasmic adaptor subunit [Geminicoccus sp.]
MLTLPAGLAACDAEPEAAVPEVRPVRTVTVEKRAAGMPVILTGRIEAEDEVALAFRLSGRMIERPVALGTRVEPGDVIARLEPHNELNALRAAEANLAAAEGQLVEARAEFRRQQTLAERGFAAQAVYDRARQALQTAQSAVDSGRALLKNAQDQVSFTELEADAEGVVTTIGAEPGEVVQTGQMIVRLARQGGRDAVFDVPAQVIRSAPADPVIAITLTEDPSVVATGRVREVAPQADPVTRTFEVRVGLADPPPDMRLGATVTGRMEVDQGEIIELPASALTQHERQPAVWVVDPAEQTVALRSVDVLRFSPGAVVVAAGIDPGETVVTAGVQALHPGQKVRLLEPAS